MTGGLQIVWVEYLPLYFNQGFASNFVYQGAWVRPLLYTLESVADYRFSSRITLYELHWLRPCRPNPPVPRLPGSGRMAR